MPDDTIAERIVALLVTALRGIQPPDYHVSLRVTRPDDEGWQQGESDANALVMEGMAISDPSIAPLTKDGYRLPIEIAFSYANPDGTEANDTILNRMEGDIRKVVRANCQFGGLAYNTIEKPVEPGAVYQLPGRLFPIEVLFATAQGDLFNQ